MTLSKDTDTKKKEKKNRKCTWQQQKRDNKISMVYDLNDQQQQSLFTFVSKPIVIFT